MVPFAADLSRRLIDRSIQQGKVYLEDQAIRTQQRYSNQFRSYLSQRQQTFRNRLNASFRYGLKQA